MSDKKGNKGEENPMDDFFLEDIPKWDNKLFQLASYEVTAGLMVGSFFN